MIKLDNITKYYPSPLGEQYIFKNIDFVIPRGNIAILGANGAGKSTLFRMIAGSEYPNSGKVTTNLHISWPVALATGIHPQMTGSENARFIGRVNGVKNLNEFEEKVKKFAELGPKFHLPVKSYSSGMRSRLAFACCISIDFDVYLIDEVTAVGDVKFKSKVKNALRGKLGEANFIMVSHNMKEIREFCESAIVIDNMQLTYYADLEEAISFYQSL
ncbi:ABC transporter ATP-binding protein [Thalassotalea agarivorans]|uniref:Capsular polysaccharide transport system ATP-binding protein n=1 Tax=Thalassotalea agarivorans TaxID=349064 RepID=A0A1H9YIK0_THASX|nr:ABC transporter ATP-binding protein [Thalassotalea agarivorans]SES68818.1 capsular polysaccharide transport system ATP-binding protein [Thalassotalea agarivorans]